MSASGKLDSLPLAVIAHDPAVGLSGERDEAFEQAWAQWQRDLASLSTNSTFQVANGVGHEIQTDRPQLVIDAITRMVKRTKQK